MPQEPIVLNQDPGENSSQSPPHIDHHCCCGCGDSLDGILCQRCTCKSCRKGAHHGYNFPPKVSIISNSEPCHDQNVDEFPQTLPSFHPTCYSRDENSFAYDSTPNLVNDSPNVSNPPSQPPIQPSQSVIDHLNLHQRIIDLTIKLRGTFQAWLQQQKDQVVNLDSYSSKPLQCQKSPICYDDDDDEESSPPLRDIIISELSPCIAITPVLYTRDSLIIWDENLDTIPEKESDEFIKSSVENLFPNPSESEDERECDVPVFDDFTTFSNLFFDANDYFSSSDNESFSDEDIPKEIYSNLLFDEKIISIKIDSRHFNAESDLIEFLLNQDSLIISSSKIYSLLDESSGELIFLKSIPSGIDEADCDPEEEIRLIEKLLYDNSSPRIDSDYSDSEGDNLFPKRLLHDYPIPFWTFLTIQMSSKFFLPSSPIQ
nr:hypothetical protein [Tanacetum cinerariifolium]